MTTQAIDLMFGLYRRKILAFLFSRPTEDFHVRQLERELEIPVGSLQRELKALSAAGLIGRRQVGNQVRYRVDPGHPLFEELAGIFRKTLGIAGVMRDALASLADSIVSAFVFGSLAKGQESSTSDVDLMVLGGATFEQVVNAVWPAQERLNRAVNAVVMTPAEFASGVRTGEGFVSRVMAEPKLFVMGTSDDLEKLVRNPPVARA
jgi:predicted nucleotidyltransferase